MVYHVSLPILLCRAAGGVRGIVIGSFPRTFLIKENSPSSTVPTY